MAEGRENFKKSSGADYESSEAWNLIPLAWGVPQSRYNIRKHEPGTMWKMSVKAEIPGKMLGP